MDSFLAALSRPSVHRGQLGRGVDEQTLVEIGPFREPHPLRVVVTVSFTLHASLLRSFLVGEVILY